MPSGDTTVPADPALRASSRPDLVFAVVLCWCVDEPERRGEAAFLDRSAEPRAREWILGRNRLSLMMQRPGEMLDCGPLRGRLLSKEQLRFRFADDALTVENVGSQRVFVDGAELPPGTALPVDAGAVIEVDGHSTFVVELRPRAIPAPRRALLPLPPVGEPCSMGFAAESPWAWEHRDEIVLAAGHDRAVVIYGETGTGKDLTAKAIHALSARAGKPFFAANCANVTAELAAALLFGTAKNWPNPGTPETPGYFGAAGDGDLFLDEIGWFVAAGQAALLRAMESGYERPGEHTLRPRRCRITAATNKGPAGLAEDVRMRFGHEIVCKPLRDRPSDIAHVLNAALLAALRSRPDTPENVALKEKLVRKDGRGLPYVVTDQSLAAKLLRHPLTGNAREVGNIAEAAVRQAERGGGGVVRWPESVPEPAVRRGEGAGAGGGAGAGAGADADASGEPAGQATPSKEQVLAALEKHRWRYALVAAELGIGEQRLYRLRVKYGLHKPGAA